MEFFEDEGYIKIWRSIKEWQHFKDVNTCNVFIFHLLLNARHKDGYTKTGVFLKRGQVLTSVNRIIRESDNFYTEQNIKTILNKLERTNEIIRHTTKKYTIITITNYEKYQKTDSAINNLTNTFNSDNNDLRGMGNKQTNKQVTNKLTNTFNSDNNDLRGMGNKQTNKQVTNNSQTGNKQVTTYNNDNNDKNEKNLSQSMPSDEEREELIIFYSKQEHIKNPRAYVNKLITNNEWKPVLDDIKQKKINAQKKQIQTSTYTPDWKKPDFVPATEEETIAGLNKLKSVVQKARANNNQKRDIIKGV